MKKIFANKYLTYLLIFLSYLMLAFIFTYPLILHFSDSVSGWDVMNDSQLFLWNFWWVKKALIDLGTNPFYTNYVYWPQNVSLTLHTLTFFPSLISVIFQFFTNNIIIVYNMIFLLTFTISGVGTYSLIKYLYKNQIIAWIGGFAFAFCPYVFAHAYAGHFNLMNTWTIPFYIYFLLRMFDRKKLIDTILASLILIIQTYTDFHYLFFMILISLMIGIYYLVKNKEKLVVNLCNIGILVLIWFIVSLPILIPTYQANKTNSEYQASRTNYEPAMQYTDLRHFLGPNYLNKIIVGNELKNKIEKEFAGGVRENNIFWGYTIIVLALLGLVFSSDKRRWLWLTIAVMFFIISLGSNIYYNQNIILENAPAKYLNDWLFKNSDIVFSRFSIISQLMFIILACALLHVLVKKKKFEKIIKPVFLIIIFFIAFEFISAPINLTKLSTSGYLEVMAKNKENFRVIILPNNMYYQTLIDKPQLVGGLGRRAHDYYVDKGNYRDINGIRLLYAINNSSLGPNEDDRNKEKTQQEFQNRDIKYIIIKKEDVPIEEVKKYREICEEVLQLKLEYEDAIITVYKTF